MKPLAAAAVAEISEHDGFRKDAPVDGFPASLTICNIRTPERTAATPRIPFPAEGGMPWTAETCLRFGKGDLSPSRDSPWHAPLSRQITPWEAGRGTGPAQESGDKSPQSKAPDCSGNGARGLTAFTERSVRRHSARAAGGPGGKRPRGAWREAGRPGGRWTGIGRAGSRHRD